MRISKLIAAVAGVLIILAGFGLTVAGGVALAVPDDDGWVSVGPVRVQSDAAAIVGDDIDIDLGDQVANGRTFVSWDAIPAAIDVETRNGKDVFIGVGPTDRVAAYLENAAIAYADWEGHGFEVDDVVGSGAAVDPSGQGFWLATSTDGTLEWDVDNGDWAVAVLNADGSRGIDVAVTGSARVPFLRAIGVGLLTAGLLALAGGATLTYFGVREVRERVVRAPEYTAPTA